MEINDDSSYLSLFDRIVATSNMISSLYIRLSGIEIRYGINSFQYKEMVSIIKTLEENEKKILSGIYNDSSVMAIYKFFIESTDCKRLKDKLLGESDSLDKVFLSTANERYDELLEKYALDVPREKFINDQYIYFGRDLFLPNVFKLIEKKKIIKLFDYYIEHSESASLKSLLIGKKNDILSRNGPLASWYFNYGDDLECLLVDIDALGSDYFNIPLENYRAIKNNFFMDRCDDFTFKALNEDLDNFTVRNFYEIFILSSLLNMDANSLDSSYRLFVNESGKFKEENVDFIDGVYEKSAILSKKIN